MNGGNMASNLTIPDLVLNQAIQQNSEAQAIIPRVAAPASIAAIGIADVFTPSLQNSAAPSSLYSQLLAPLSASALEQSPFAAPLQGAYNSFTTVANNNAALQELNNALAAVGLDTANTNKIDGIASLINNFNPAAFLGIAYQLKAQEDTTAPANATTPSTAAAINPLGSGALVNTSNPANNNVALQKLNASLESIGLNRADINKIDGIASLINNFDPAAFAILAFQLKAQETARGGAAATTAPAQIPNAAV